MNWTISSCLGDGNGQWRRAKLPLEPLLGLKFHTQLDPIRVKSSVNVCRSSSDPDVFYLFCLPSGQFLNGSYCSFEDGECGWKPISGRGLSWRRAQTPGKVTRQSCSSSGSRRHLFWEKHVNRGLNVPSPEIQELEIKISPWELLNDCAAYLQGGGGGWATSL